MRNAIPPSKHHGARSGPEGVNWSPRFLFDHVSPFFRVPWFLRVLSPLLAESMRWIGSVLWIAAMASCAGAASSRGGNGAIAASGSQSGSGTAVRTGTVFVIHLEQKKNDKAVAMFPGHVFQPGDVVRFRVTARGMEGYLYVIDQGSSGAYTTLYPAQGSHADTFLHVDQDVFVPSVEDGWFEVGGPAGFDVLYFVVSPKPIDIPPSSGEGGAPEPAPLPDSMKPRCDDSIFKARGECVDSTAGPAPLARDVPLPPQIKAAAKNAARDLVLEENDEDHSVKATAPLDKPAVYVFRLAHQ